MAVTNESREGTTNPSLADEALRRAKSEDRPVGRQSPQAPFALVGLSYLAALAIVGLIVGLVLFWMAR